jgi:LTXXQ motif family protein
MHPWSAAAKRRANFLRRAISETILSELRTIRHGALPKFHAIEWRADRLAELIKPPDAQRTKFDEFKSASIKSAEVMRSTCQADIPETIVGRTEAMEKRMDTMLQAIRTMRPALEAFDATPSDEQKSRLDSNYGHSRFWRWRDRW